jgi:hypothetical protein
MGDPMMPRRGLAQRVARASPLGLAAGILAAAGALAGGVPDLLPAEPAATSPAPPAFTALPEPSQAQIAEARARLRETLASSAPPGSPAVDAMAKRSIEIVEPAVPRADPSPGPPAQVAADDRPSPQPWTEPARAAPPPEPAPPDPDAPWTSVPQPNLRDKAELMLAKGEVASARLWLVSAMDRGDAEAVFRLAETYDPNLLALWGVVGLSSDPHKARELYAKALSGGVEAARERIARLSPHGSGGPPR